MDNKGIKKERERDFSKLGVLFVDGQERVSFPRCVCVCVCDLCL